MLKRGIIQKEKNQTNLSKSFSSDAETIRKIVLTNSNSAFQNVVPSSVLFSQVPHGHPRLGIPGYASASLEFMAKPVQLEIQNSHSCGSKKVNAWGPRNNTCFFMFPSTIKFYFVLLPMECFVEMPMSHLSLRQAHLQTCDLISAPFTMALRRAPQQVRLKMVSTKSLWIPWNPCKTVVRSCNP